MRSAWMLAVVLGVAAPAGLARAQELNQVTVGDLAGTDGEWQAGEVVVDVPAAEVQRWFSDSSRWEERFPDDKKVRDLGRTPDGRHVVKYHSRALGKTVTFTLSEKPGEISYTGKGSGVRTEGKITFKALGPSRTRITMLTTGELHGLTGVIATEGMKRKKARKKLRADLEAAVALAKEYDATRGGGAATRGTN